MSRDIFSTGYIIAPDNKGVIGMTIYSVELEGIHPQLDAIDEEGETITTRHAISYNFSRRGGCGSILILPNKNRNVCCYAHVWPCIKLDQGRLIDLQLLAYPVKLYTCNVTHIY